MKKKSSKWKSDKRKMGVTAFFLLIISYIVDANGWVIVPDSVTYMLGLIAMTWLVMEGYVDSKSLK